MTDIVSVSNLTPEEVSPLLEMDGKGKPLRTIDNFLTVMVRDRMYAGVHFNQMTNRPEIHGATADSISEWTDTDSAESERYIQTAYRLHHSDMHSKALRILFRRREYNPLLSLVESFEWDGMPRIECFLSTVLRADDSNYSREVSRLIFAGGINRLYQPGCKFDCVPVLIGKQGAGKTSIISWLALNDNYYTTTNNLTGDQRAIEALSGAWIVEIPELAAFRSADMEALKAFVTLKADRYRLPFDRNTSTLPRRCIFIGSTNSRQFLTDKTGNRRFFPVVVRSDGYELLRDEREIREYICQCWAEARERYKAGKLSPFPDPELLQDYQNQQQAAMEEDWRIGVIQDYVNHLSKEHLICSKEIFDRALYPDGNRTPAKRELIEISQILDTIPELEKLDQRRYTANYGQQRVWKLQS